MMCEKGKLVLFYDPLAEENTICTTDLTSLSTNCKFRKINEKIYILRDKFFVQQAVMSSIENIVLYSTDVFNLNINFTVQFQLPTDNAVYSFGVLGTTNVQKANRVDVPTTSITTLNLLCLSGNPKFTKLDYIIPGSNNGLPVTRTLIFYNDKIN
jgi:hypothetical protein